MASSDEASWPCALEPEVDLEVKLATYVGSVPATDQTDDPISVFFSSDWKEVTMLGTTFLD